MGEPTLLDRFEVVLRLMEAMEREGIPFDQALRILRSGFGMFLMEKPTADLGLSTSSRVIAVGVQGEGVEPPKP